MTIDADVKIFESEDLLIKNGGREYYGKIYTVVQKKQTFVWNKTVFKIKQDVPYIRSPYYDNAYVSNDYLKTMAKQEKYRILKMLTDDTTD